jgi:hypothetical protein
VATNARFIGAVSWDGTGISSEIISYLPPQDMLSILNHPQIARLDSAETFTETKTFDKGVAHDEQQVTGTATLALTDVGDEVLYTGTGGHTLTLPLIDSDHRGRRYFIKNQGSGNPSVLARGGTNTMNGSAVDILFWPGDTLVVIAPESGNNWSVSVIPNPISFARLSEDNAWVGGPQNFAYGAALADGSYASSDTFVLTSVQNFYYTGSGGDTLTLPSISDLYRKRRYRLYNQGTGPVVFSRGGSDTINGGSSSITIYPGEAIEFHVKATGSNWAASLLVDPADFVRSYSAAMYLNNSGSPTHSLTGTWQDVDSGGGTDAWTSVCDVRPSGVSAQVDTTSGSADITIRKTGMYLVVGTVRFDSLADGIVYGAAVYVNGSAGPLDVRSAGAASVPHAKATELMSLTEGDVLSLYAYQGSGGAEAYHTADAYSNRLSAVYCGPSS